MAPKRTGTAERKGNGSFILRICLGGGKRHSKVFRPRKTLGAEEAERYAKEVAQRWQDLYDAGKWAPGREVANDQEVADPVEACGPSSTLYEFAIAWAKAQTYESAPKDLGVLKRYLSRAPAGRLIVTQIEPVDAREFARWLTGQPSERGGTLAPRTVRTSYDVVKRAFDDAVFRKWCPSNPFSDRVARKALPPVMDKTPGERESWSYSRREVERLISDPGVPWDRRVGYAIVFLTGCRIGELGALRWRDWNRTLEPLGRITIARAIKSVSRTEGHTKTLAVKHVPVHPTLKVVLDEWHRLGWSKVYGRDPEPDDFIVPTRKNRPKLSSQGNRDLERDCNKLKIVHRHQHCERHTFIRLALEDGAERPLIEPLTHQRPRAAFDGYAGIPWPRVCLEVSKLRIARLPAQADG